MKQKKYKKINEKVYTFTLENQLKVYFIPRKGFQSKMAIIAAKFGSFYSQLNLKRNQETIKIPYGTAHFLEHRMFSIKNQDATELFSNLGASSNAYTSYTTTAYYFKCNDQFYENLDILLSMISSFDSSESQIENEKQIIIEELNMYKDNPYTKLMQTLYQNSYAVHPINQDVGGDEKSVKSIDKKILLACFDAYYQPANLALVIVGDLDLQELKDYLSKMTFFENKGQHQKIKKISFKNEPLSILKQKDIIQKDVSIPMFGMLFKLKPVLPKKMQLEYLKTEILLSYFFDASGIYTEEWLKQKIITSAIGYYHGMNIDLNYIIIYNINNKYENAINHILEVFDKKHFTMTLQDLNRIKNKLVGSILKEHESVEDLSKEYLAYLFDGMDYFEEIDILEQITLDDIRETYLSISNAPYSIAIERKDVK